MRQRLLMKDLWLIFTSEGKHDHCVGPVNGDETVLEYSSGPWSLKVKITSRGVKGWKDLRKIFWSVTASSAPQTLQNTKGDRTTLSAGWNCAARRPQFKYDWLSINTVGKTATTWSLLIASRHTCLTFRETLEWYHSVEILAWRQNTEYYLPS